MTEWNTAISQIQPNSIRVRGTQIGDLIDEGSYASSAFLVICARRPTPAEARMFEAILISCLDHGVTPPSTVSARTVASCGVPLATAVAAGVMAIGRHHGGAVEASMGFFYDCVRSAEQSGRSIEDAAASRVARARADKRRISGFGHPLHTEDPRTERLLAIAEQLGLAGAHVRCARAVCRELGASLGRKITMNVDGAIAALLCEMSVPARLGNAPFIISRVPGLIAHVHEEETRERPMRAIVPAQAVYDGP